jgi:hypothetical protein
MYSRCITCAVGCILRCRRSGSVLLWNTVLMRTTRRSAWTTGSLFRMLRARPSDDEDSGAAWVAVVLAELLNHVVRGWEAGSRSDTLLLHTVTNGSNP